MLDEIVARGGALAMLRGPVAGPSLLLSRTARTADDRGLLVLRTIGVDARADLPHAGLRRLLRPVLWRLDELPESCSSALEVAFGRVDGAQPHAFRLAFAVLDLLAAAAFEVSVVVIVDDMHRLDRASADVLCIVARWLRNDRVAVLLAGRSARSRTLAGDDLEHLKLGTFQSRPAAALPPAATHLHRPWHDGERTRALHRVVARR
jgi:hypothetical protein